MNSIAQMRSRARWSTACPLTDELGVEFDRADEESCKMEHGLSEDTMDRWIAHMERDGIKLVD